MKSLVLTVVAFLAPVFVLAQTVDFQPIETALDDVRGIVDIAIPIAIALAVLFFFWGLAVYILNASGDPGKREEGRTRMIWGVIALFIIVSIWGIVGFLGSLLGIGQGGTAPVPGVADTQGGPGEDPSIINPGT